MTPDPDAALRRMHLHAFKIAGVGHSAIGTWRNPYNQEHRYTDLDYWLDTARVLERGRFDSLFMADFPGLHSGYKGGSDAAFAEAIAVPLNDPMMAIGAMAAVTEHLGFAVTASTTYEQPYSFARKMTTLDHLTKGRIGWNIVTSYTASAARNLGLERQIPHDERYAIADEFMQVVYKLWEGSWEDDAVIRDVARGVHTDPRKVHAVDHCGKYFTVIDPFLCEPSPQRTPTLIQAGASSEGQAFAARHAEVVFLVGTEIDIVRRAVDKTVAAAQAVDRNRADIQFIAGVSVVVAPTDEEAQAKFAQQIQFVSIEGTLARQSAFMQLDFGQMDLDAPIQHVESDGMRTWLERFTIGDPDRAWTPRQAAQKVAESLGAISVVGSPTTVADQLEQMMVDGDVDGFNVFDNLPLRTLPDFVDLVVPELQRRGRVPVTYAASTLRENVTGHSPRLPRRHPGASYRRDPSTAGVTG